MQAPQLPPGLGSITAYDVTTPTAGTHRGLPSPTLTLILPLEEPLEVSWAGVPGSRRSTRSLITGLHTTPAHIHHGRRQVGIQLQLTPRGARALTGLPPGVLAGQLCTLEDLAGDAPEALVHLPDEVATLPGDAALALVTRRLTEVLAAARAHGSRPEVDRALAQLARGQAVAAVAGETGLSRRHLGTLVRAECGVSPKQFQRLARFTASVERWQSVLRAGAGTVADVAASTGYADQAHLTREWTAFAGCTPTTWAREEFPNVQAPEALGAAG